MNSLLRFSTTGTDSFHQRTHGLQNSRPMPRVWRETSHVVTNDVVSTMKTNFLMVDPNANDVTMTISTDTIAKTPSKVQSKSQPVSASGLSATCPNALVNE